MLSLVNMLIATLSKKGLLSKFFIHHCVRLTIDETFFDSVKQVAGAVKLLVHLLKINYMNSLALILILFSILAIGCK